MNSPGMRRNLAEIPLRRPPTAVEVARARRALADRPEDLQAWEEERRLAVLLHQLPTVPITPGFTARVLAAVDRGDESDRAPAGWWMVWGRVRRWGPALAAIVVIPVLWWYQASTEPTRLARSLATVTRPVQEAGLAVQMPPVQVFMDFEAIDQMRRLSTLVDEDLLASLEFPGP